jgi:hypothetical protein
MGFIFRETGQLEHAIAAFEKSLNIDPSGRWVVRQLAEIREMLAEKQEP